MSLKVLTANRLLDGEVVYYNGVWVEDISRSRVVSDSAGYDELLSAGKIYEEKRNEVVNVYLIEVKQDLEGKIIPLSFRELIRSQGPTTALHHGKQAGIEE